MAGQLSIFIAEDEPLVAMMLEEFLDALGHRTAITVDDVDGSLERAAGIDCDAAILDVHLCGKSVWPLADVLADRGVPILLATGGQTEPPPARYADAAVLAKPYTLAGVQAALEQITAAR
jgi:DNA-binding response OmpR family regulator